MRRLIPYPRLYVMLQCTREYRCLFDTLISNLLGEYPGVGLLDYTVILFLVFGRTSLLSFIVAVPIYIPADRVQGFPFLHINNAL